jgi:molecular chaperone DnaK (HSP70)
MHVSAREQRSGKEAEIQVQPSYGLTDEQVETMILDSFDNAEKDLADRQLIEARNEAETILTALVKGRNNEAWTMLSIAEQRKVEELESKLRAAMSGADYQQIRQSIDELNQATMHLAELMMDAAVGGALRGKNMESTGMSEGPTAPHPIGKAEFS